jgi:GntR family transcriptional regulator, transcriptional repressor for pyruvate dehydrogenase complex
MKKLEFEPLLIERASSRIEKTIKEAILRGTLKTGDRLPTEKEMALQFGVSLVTLREALRALETSGLVKKRKANGRGIFVSEINSESIKASLGHFLSFKALSPQHLYEVRKIIEPATVRLAAEKITLVELEELEKNVTYCEERLAETGPTIGEKDFFELDAKNNDFHRLIAQATHNPILILTLDYVFDFLEGCETNLLVPDITYSTDNVRDHKHILKYLKQGNGERCEREMVSHLKRLDEYASQMEQGRPAVRQKKIDLPRLRSGRGTRLP